MKMAIHTFVAAAISLAAFSAAHAANDAASDAKKRADTEYKIAADKCKPLKGNAQDVCEKDAKAARDKTKADVNAAAKGTPEARADARETKAKADYKAGDERCESMSGKDKTACESQAKAKLDRRQADADKERKAK